MKITTTTQEDTVDKAFQCLRALIRAFLPMSDYVTLLCESTHEYSTTILSLIRRWLTHENHDAPSIPASDMVNQRYKRIARGPPFNLLRLVPLGAHNP